MPGDAPVAVGRDHGDLVIGGERVVEGDQALRINSIVVSQQNPHDAAF
jgi:hypothetical protein